MEATAPASTTDIEMATMPPTALKQDDQYLITFDEPFDADSPK